jgi:uncharacterized membrane protein YidH (DUF202 family)
MASFGFGMVAFFRSMLDQSRSPEAIRLHRGAIRMGTMLIILGIVGAVLASSSHWLTLRKRRRGESPDLTGWSLSVVMAILIVIIKATGITANRDLSSRMTSDPSRVAR